MTKLTGLQITDLIKASGLFYEIIKVNEVPAVWRCAVVRWTDGHTWTGEGTSPYMAIVLAAMGNGLLSTEGEIAMCPPGYVVPGESYSGDAAAATKAERERCVAACRVLRKTLMAAGNYEGATTCSTLVAMIESGRAM